METVNDIVRDMYTHGRLDEKSTDKIPRSLLALALRTYADRIESAMEKAWNIKKMSNCYAYSIILRVSDHNNHISHYAFRTMIDAIEVLNILSSFTGIPIDTTDNKDYCVGNRIELIVYPF